MNEEDLKAYLIGVLLEDRGKIPAVKHPQCSTCKHMVPRTLTCTAYPNGIPSEILDNKVLHTKPYPGDQGIQYEKK